ncbi:MAG: hypothetical protein QM705_13120 [Ancrocorticia sp.]
MSKAEVIGARQVDSSEEYIEVWNDLVSPRDLTWSLAICGGSTVAALLIATFLSASLFFWGLGGSVLGFIICAVVFSPKRAVRIIEAGESASGSATDSSVADSSADSALAASQLSTNAGTDANAVTGAAL